MTRKPIISICGDSYVPPGNIKRELAERLGKVLVDAGYRIMNGGMGGIMEAASRGARSSESYRSGDIIGILPGYDTSDANRFVDIPIATGLDHVRNQIVANSDAVIAMGGGAGTLSEICFAWMMGRLVIAYRVERWSGKLADTKLDHRIRYADIEEDRIFGVKNEEEVMDILAGYLSRYGIVFQSMD